MLPPVLPFGNTANDAVPTDANDAEPVLLRLGVGARDSTAALNLATIGFAEISGRGLKAESEQIRAYAAYEQYSAGGAASVKKGGLLVRSDALLVREALYQLHNLVRDSGVSEAKLKAIRLISEDAERARKIFLAADMQQGGLASAIDDGLEIADYAFDSFLRMARPLLVGTCPGLNPAINKLPFPMRPIAYYLMNDFFRSFGNLFWCCNPWSGVLFFFAIACSSDPSSGEVHSDASYQAAICAVAVVVSGLTGELMGAGRGIMALGLLQFGCIISCQVVTHQLIHTPSADSAAEVDASSYVLVVITSVLTTFFTLVMNSFVIQLTGVIPYALPVGLAIFLMRGIGFRSNELLSMRAEGADPLAIYVGDASTAPLWSHDWSLALEASFRGIGSCMWADGWASAVLCWVGIWLCSPILAMLGMLGSLVGTCAMIAMDLSTAEIYGAWWQWEPILACLVIGGLIFHISLPSVVAGAFAALLNTLLGSSARAFLRPISVPVGPFGHGTALFVVTLVRFHKTFMAPVPLAEMSVPEDHLRQRLLARKAMRCVLSTLPDLANTSSESTAADTTTLGGMALHSARGVTERVLVVGEKATAAAINVKQRAAGVAAGQMSPAARQMSNRVATGMQSAGDVLRLAHEPTKVLRKLGAREQLTNMFYLLVSFGAYNVRTFELVTHEYKVSHADLVFIGKLYGLLDKEMLGLAGGADGADEATRQAGALAVLLLAGLLEMSEVAVFRERWATCVAEVDTRLGEAATHEVFFVYFMLRSMRQRSLLQQWESFFSFVDGDHSGKLSLAELQVGAELAFPGDTALVRRAIQGIVEKVDTDGDVELDPSTFVRMTANATNSKWAALLGTLPDRMSRISRSETKTTTPRCRAWGAGTETASSSETTTPRCRAWGAGAEKASS